MCRPTKRPSAVLQNGPAQRPRDFGKGELWRIAAAEEEECLEALLKPPEMPEKGG